MAWKHIEYEDRAITDDELKTKFSALSKDFLVEYILYLRTHKAFYREDRLKLQILDNVALNIWACDRDHNIVLWDGDCATNYKIAKDQAIGHNYLFTIVNELERRQSKIDCDYILNTGEKQPFRLCEDADSHGMPLRIVTQCCRIVDGDDIDNINDHLQAELAIRIDYETLKRESDEFLVKEKKELNEITSASDELVNACNEILNRLATIANEKMNYFIGIHTPSKGSPQSVVNAMEKISEIRREYTGYFRNKRDYFKTRVVDRESQEGFISDGANHSFEYTYREESQPFFVNCRTELDLREIEFMNELYDVGIDALDRGES